MLKEILEATRLSPEFCASLARVPVDQFRAWVDQREPIPAFVTSELAAVLGVSKNDFFSHRASRTSDEGSSAPAIWFKLRDERLTQLDREFVGLVRRLGFSMAQFDAIRSVDHSAKWRAVAGAIHNQTDRSAPPVRQGQEAASRFRSAANLEHGQTGIGELLRPRLRQVGLVVVESPIPKSSLEGCCFDIGAESGRPCVFANTYKSTWFRRNEILLHEVGHAIFDLENDPVSLDFAGSTEAVLSEARARAFSQACLVPLSVLTHYVNQIGIKWVAVSPLQLARLMGEIHVEQSTIIRAAFEAGLIGEELRNRYLSLDCSRQLREISYHTWSTRDYLRTLAKETPMWIATNRNTTLGARKLRLPAGYVQDVIEAANEGEISLAKAAELLMMDRYTFSERFGDLITEPSV